MAEAGRGELPNEFFIYRDAWEASLFAGDLPKKMTFRGIGHGKWYSSICPLIAAELYRLMCTDDSYYSSVRSHWAVLGVAGVAAVAATVVKATGADLSVVTSAVAFLVLSLVRGGISVFCRAWEAKGQKGDDII